MKDRLNNEIKQGSLVAYAQAYGRSAELLFGYVIEIDFRPGKQYAQGTEGILVNTQTKQIFMRPRNVIAIPDEMQPDIRREKLNDAEEAVQVSDI